MATCEGLGRKEAWCLTTTGRVASVRELPAFKLGVAERKTRKAPLVFSDGRPGVRVRRR